jgi:hypothetical protein
MKTLRIYLDTSVLGGCFDAEFDVWSNGLMEDFRAGRFIPVLSDLLAAEVSRAPERVRNLHRELLGLAQQQSIEVSTEALHCSLRTRRTACWDRSTARTCCTSRWRPWPTRTSW